MKTNTRKQPQYLLQLLLALGVLLGFLTAVSHLDEGNRREGQLRLEETLKRAEGWAAFFKKREVFNGPLA